MRSLDRIIRSSAPVRLDFAGAWSDVAPFATQSRGVVINAAIDLRTQVTLQLNQTEYHLRADDLDQELRASSVTELVANGTLDLHKAAIRRSQMSRCTLRSFAEAPLGSGLGTSGALSVALVAAIDTSIGRERSQTEIARDAWQLETVDAAVPGGQQDQYAAALAGFQYLEFDHGTTTARHLRIDPEFAAELAAHTVICYTGRSRFSGNTIARVMDALVGGDAVVGGALRALVDIAEAMAPALESGDLHQVGRLLAANWDEQQRLAPGMSTDDMQRLEQAMVDAGAIGGKAAGAGAGGSMFFVVPDHIDRAVAAAWAQGATVLPTRWTDEGVRTA